MTVIASTLKDGSLNLKTFRRQLLTICIKKQKKFQKITRVRSLTTHVRVQKQSKFIKKLP